MATAVELPSIAAAAAIEAVTLEEAEAVAVAVAAVAIAVAVEEPTKPEEEPINKETTDPEEDAVAEVRVEQPTIAAMKHELEEAAAAPTSVRAVELSADEEAAPGGGGGEEEEAAADLEEVPATKDAVVVEDHKPLPPTPTPTPTTTTTLHA